MSYGNNTFGSALDMFETLGHLFMDLNVLASYQKLSCFGLRLI